MTGKRRFLRSEEGPCKTARISSYLFVHGVQVHGVHVADEAGEGSVEPKVGHLVGRVRLHDGVLFNLRIREDVNLKVKQ